jgi:hypothetical protein
MKAQRDPGSPDWMDVQYYALFEGRGWHAVQRWTEMQDVKIACGHTYSLWNGERVVAVTSEQPEGLCGECERHLTVQAEMLEMML